MTLSTKTKSQLIAEVKKLQRKLDAVQKDKDKTPVTPKPSLATSKWDSFFLNSLNTIIVVDKKGKILDVNKVERPFVKEKVIGLSAYVFVSKDAAKNMRAAIEKVFKTKKSQEYNSWREDAKGVTYYYKSKATAIIENKKVVAAIIDVTEITNEINTQIKLKESEERFRALAQNAADLIYRCRVYPDFQYEYISPSVKEMTGYTAEEFYSNPYLGFEIVHPEDAHLLGESEKLIKNKLKLNNVKGPEIIVRWIRKDRSVIWTETRTKPVFDNKKRLVAIEGISRDITKQKLSEEKSKDSEERFKLLSNATFEGIVFSESGKIIDANDQFIKMFGYKSLKEIIGKSVIDDFVVEEQKILAKKFLRISVSKPFEVDTIRKDGTIMTVETKGQNIPYFGKTIRATVIYNITERKLYETSLRESERTLSTLMNNLPGMAYRCENDDKWTMRFVSKGFQELTGYNPKEIINNKKRSFSDIIHPKDRHLGKEDIRRALQKQAPFEIEYRLITASGEEKWVWEKGEGVFSDDGKLLFLEGFITDIGDKKQFEKELKRSRENYKSLVDYSPDGVIIHVDGIIKFANPSALKIIGVRGFEELENVPAFEFFLPEYHQLILDRIKRTKAGEDLDFVEVKIKNKKGEIIVLETKSILIRFNGEEAIQVVFHDVSEKKLLLKEQARAQIAEETNELLEQEITKRKVIQLQLQESQKYTHLIINGSIDMICASDRKGHITEFNQAAQKTFGYTAEEVIGKHVSMLYSDPNQRNRITDEELYKKGAFAGEVLNRRKNGENFVSYLSASILKNDQGEVIGAMGVSRDISELKKADEALKTQSAKFNAIIESSSHFIWTVDRRFCLTTFNQNFSKEVETRYGERAKIGQPMFFIRSSSDKHQHELLIKKYEGAFRGEPQYFDISFLDSEGTENWREIYLNPILASDGSVIEVSGISHDVTEKKISEERIRLSLQEKEVLLKEVHHRVKNNLQVISSILNLQSSYVKEEGTLQILKESQNRIKSMAFIHESLYQTKDFSSINFTEYIINLSQNLIHSYSNFDNEVKLNLDIQDVFLNLDLAIPCGLIINEIVSNALKYAFDEKTEGGEISIKMSLDKDDLVLKIGDNGKGLPKNIDYRNTESLGLQLVVTLTDQLSGTIELNSEKGTNYTIIFKHNQVKNRI